MMKKNVDSGTPPDSPTKMKRDPNNQITPKYEKISELVNAKPEPEKFKAG